MAQYCMSCTIVSHNDAVRRQSRSQSLGLDSRNIAWGDCAWVGVTVMSEKQETLQIILDTAEKIFADYCDKTLLDEAERGDFPHRLWQQVSQNGFDRLGAPNSGTDAQDMYALIKQSGRFAVPLPLAETLLVQLHCNQNT